MKYITAVPVTTAVILKIEEAKAFFHLGGFWRKPTAGGAWSGTISTHQQELNLRTWALANGWNGTSAATITVDAGVYIWSDNTATPALTINGSWPGGITLVNNGYIIGRGSNANSGGAAGTAVELAVGATINSASGYIAGGGGGGGTAVGFTTAGGGGGAGGGEGGNGYQADLTSPAAGGIGGTVGLIGSNGLSGSSAGGGGGRILPGTGGIGPSSITSDWSGAHGRGGGSGGSGGSASFGAYYAYGGSGGSGSLGGSTPTNTGAYGKFNDIAGGGGGGGWGALGGYGSICGDGGTNAAMGNPGSGGKAVALNGNTVTWVGGFPSTKVFGAVS